MGKLASYRALYRANRKALSRLEKEAVAFISKVCKRESVRLPMVSFSGGKDSTVVSHLVRKALRKRPIAHVFGDTTIEYPDTYEYIDTFIRSNIRVPFHQVKCSNDFFNMCQLLGPPSRINAWCCSVFKSSPIAGLVNSINDSNGVISFEGIRRNESTRRRLRERLYRNKKIVHQLSAYPILEWKEIHVWMYILTNRLAFNKAYLKGVTRVGCLFCPNNRPRNEHILWIAYPSEMDRFKNLICSYASKIGKKDPDEYYSSGAWKMRVGKTDAPSPIYVRKVACLSNADAMHFILDVPIGESFIDRFKPFGRLVNYADSNSQGFTAFDQKSGESLFMLRRIKDVDTLRRESKIDPAWKLGTEFLCVDVLSRSGKKKLLTTIERQIRKYQACVSCGACAGVCPTGAITINPHFRVSEDKCVHCGRCLNTRLLKASCVSINSQQQSRRFVIDHRIQ
jgi:phosphoadenosine phosphosulfate reductase